MHQFTVKITDFITDPTLEQDILKDVANVEALQTTEESALHGKVENADALIVYHFATISRATIERLERCKVIARGGVGYDNVDLEAARIRGIPICNVPDYGTEDVADSAVSMAVSLVRGIPFLNARLRDGLGPWSHTQAAPLQRVRGSVFGIIGLGRIGTAAAQRAKAHGMDVVFYDPYKQDGYDKSLGIRRAETLKELLSQAFVLSVHAPLTDETRLMINADAIAQMPRGSYLINTARGAIVDTNAIPDAVASGQLAGAGIDVFEWEKLREDDPLVLAWRNPEHPASYRVLITPHSAFYSEQSLIDLRTKAAQTCRRALLGHPLRNIVNGYQS
ncbi:MAG: C-terminal binding protein [bacterium]|nr:C-terminal binding protein [bacterium]